MLTTLAETVVIAAPAPTFDWLHALMLVLLGVVPPLWKWLMAKVQGNPTADAVIHGVEAFAMENPEVADELKATIKAKAEARGIQPELDKLVQKLTNVPSMKDGA